MSTIKHNGSNPTQDFAQLARSPQYYMAKARYAREDGDRAKARIFLSEGVEQHPADARLWHEYAKSMLSDRHLHNDTLRCLERAHNLAPQDMFIAMDLASHLVRQKDYVRAETIYIGILAGEGETPRVLCAMGHAYQNHGKWPLALACFSRAVELNPDDIKSVERYAEMVQIAHRPAHEGDRLKLAERIGRAVEILVDAPLKRHIDNPLGKRP